MHTVQGGTAAESRACASHKVRARPEAPRRCFRLEARGAKPGSAPLRASANPAVWQRPARPWDAVSSSDGVTTGRSARADTQPYRTVCQNPFDMKPEQALLFYRANRKLPRAPESEPTNRRR